MSYRRGFEGDFAVGSVTGLRHWNLSEDDGLLHGAWGTWQPGENVAECKAGSLYYEPHAVPSEDCGCGFWAYWQKPAATEVSGKNVVVGVIEGYGPVLIGDLGFRAAKARIVALHCTFKIMREKRPGAPGRVLWTPEPGMLWRGPQGMDMFNTLTGRCQTITVVDEDATIELQNLLEAAYEVPVYGSMDAMMLLHPATTEYLPDGDGQCWTCRCGHLGDATEATCPDCETKRPVS